MNAKDGGPAFPHGPIGDSMQGEDGRIWHQHSAGTGMSLRDWFAGRETLADWDAPTASMSDNTAIALAGEPKPKGGWAEDPVGMLKWEAKWRSALKYLRADAMLAEREKRGGQ